MNEWVSPEPVLILQSHPPYMFSSASWHTAGELAEGITHQTVYLGPRVINFWNSNIYSLGKEANRSFPFPLGKIIWSYVSLQFMCGTLFRSERFW